MIVVPKRMFGAVDKDGRIADETLRTAPADAQYSAGNSVGKPWPKMAAEGWKVLPLVIGPAPEEGDATAPVLPRMPPDPGGGTSRVWVAPAPVEVRPTRDMAILKC